MFGIDQSASSIVWILPVLILLFSITFIPLTILTNPDTETSFSADHFDMSHYVRSLGESPELARRKQGL